MNVVLDVLVAVILIWSAAAATKKGFIKSLLGMVSVVAAFVMTFLFSGQAAKYISEKFVAPAMRSSAISYLSRVLGTPASAVDAGQGAANVPVEKLLSDMPQLFLDYLKKLGADAAGVKAAAAASSTVTQARDAAVDAMITPMAAAISSVLAYLAVFLLSLLAFTLLAALLDLVFKLPVLNTLNRFGGFIMGCITGLLLVFVFCAAVELLRPVFASQSVFAVSDEAIEKTLLFGVFYKLNILDIVF